VLSNVCPRILAQHFSCGHRHINPELTPIPAFLPSISVVLLPALLPAVPTAGEKFHVEPAARYFGADHAAFDSIIFRAADILPAALPDHEVCGKAHKQMLVRQNELRPSGRDNTTAATAGKAGFHDTSSISSSSGNKRQRRAATACSQACTCPVLLLADQKFFQSNYIGKGSVDRTVAHMVQTMADVDILCVAS